MWQCANTFKATYGDGEAIALKEFDGKQSVPVQLCSHDIRTKGMNLESVNAATLYIAISKEQPFSSDAAPSPNTETFPFMQVEITYSGQQADVADLTAINYFSFPMSLISFNGKDALQMSGFGTHSGQHIIEALQNTYPKNATGAYPVVKDNHGKVIRVLGPSSAYRISPEHKQHTGGYSTFKDYLKALYEQQNGTPPCKVRLSYTGNGGYTADATVTKHHGNYGVTIENVFVNDKRVDGSIVLNPDNDNDSPTSVTIYSGVLHKDAGQPTGDFAKGKPHNDLVSTLLASLSASLVTGAAGSKTVFPGSKRAHPENEYRFQPSNTWFTQNSPTAKTDPGKFFKELQSDHSFYDRYFEVISKYSDYSLYGSPYADRFSNWSVAVNATRHGLPSQPYKDWTPVDSMLINIGPLQSLDEID